MEQDAKLPSPIPHLDIFRYAMCNIIYPSRTERWSKVPGIIKDTEAVARNLEEGTEYEFRVMAVNEHGESKPLVTSEPIKAKHPFGKSFFSVSNVNSEQ